ncbi:sensor domain-containing diguanylate cyclase [Undibacterium parvum]|uniref:Sensor domain-containing diguanylate cyclase n=1 Tax=Undibacterium parvum TaxID=401471 RepID=A0A3S9HHX5_9BURK|nr:sensor domain-containing diguanylate cyclase [Undibacterium parvum]AZP11689.1 sensor domain-containing diguanylate cyclase [Undibacterium parvum]
MQFAFLKLPMASKICRENLSSIALASLSMALLFTLFSVYLGQKNLRLAAHYQAEVLAGKLAYKLKMNDVKGLEASILKASERSDFLSVLVYDKNAQALVAWNDLKQFEKNSSVPASELIDQAQSKLQIAMLTTEIPVFYEDEIIGKIQMSSSIRWLYLQAIFSLLGALLAACIISLISAFYLSKRQLRRLAPLSDLDTVSHQVATLNDYSLRVRLHEGHELNHLNLQFNQIMEGIESWETDRQSEMRERQEAERRLDILSNHDSLTKLPNRKYFQQLLGSCIREACELQQLAALMFIDLDNFKALNEQFGYEAGDLILATIANRLSATLRNTDTLCRVDGDEFAAILPQIESPEMALALAERLIHAINRPMSLRGRKIVINGSIGIACCPLHAKEIRLLLNNTDLALKNAKASGKNAYLLFSHENVVSVRLAQQQRQV